MKKLIFTMLTLFALTGASLAQDVVITEINYNNPGTDNYEFVELYNKGNAAVQLQGWAFSGAITYIMPAQQLDPGQYLVIAGNSVAFSADFGFTPLDWNNSGGNVLNNTGENIILSDASGAFVDSVHYFNAAPWPTGANGQGSSLVLCDVNTDNSNPANWAAAITPTGVVSGGLEILANPGTASACATGPLVTLLFPGLNALEDIGGVQVGVIIAGGNANPTSVTIAANASSTMTAPGDYTTTLPVTITFPGGVAADTQTVVINVIDDSDIEPTETLTLDLTNATNGATVASSGFVLNISDNDTPLTGAMVITGIFDTQVESGGTWAKGCELKALVDIPDLSIFSVGFANNGGGSDGPEVPLPAISVAAGECIYVANDSILFANFFGFPPTVTNTDAGINGDDAIELFENSQVIDVFGDISYVAGSTLDWNYLDGWAYRKDGTGPDGGVFNLNYWNYSGINVFDLQTSNATATVPFPACDYSPVAPTNAEANDDTATTDLGTAVIIAVLSNDVLPNPVSSINIVTPPTNGTVVVNGINNVTYTPSPGYCGPDVFMYEVCDLNGCDPAIVNITVECPVVFTQYSIAEVTEVNNDGSPVLAGVTAEIKGIVHGIDYQGVNPTSGAPLQALQFYLIDNTGGISVFSGNDFGYTVQEGDEVIVRGEIQAFNCLTQISNIDSLWAVSSGNQTETPSITTFIDEDFESELVELTNLTMVDPAQWLGNGSSFNVEVTNGSFTNIMRIDNDCELSSMPAPVGPFHARGLGGQFDNSAPCDLGYQFYPRYAADIILLNATEESVLEGKISFYPNPVSDVLFLKTDIISVDDVIMSNALGQQVLRVKNPGNRLDVSQLEAGVYFISFEVDGTTWTSKFVKA